jgi:hypothetical protein
VTAFLCNGDEKSAMARKKHPPDYDGPTINGRPASSVREIQKWFSDEGCIIPMEDAAANYKHLRW